MCCSVLQRLAMCCSVLQCVAVCYSMLQCVTRPQALLKSHLVQSCHSLQYPLLCLCIRVMYRFVKMSHTHTYTCIYLSDLLLCEVANNDRNRWKGMEKDIYIYIDTYTHLYVHVSNVYISYTYEEYIFICTCINVNIWGIHIDMYMYQMYFYPFLFCSIFFCPFLRLHVTINEVEWTKRRVIEECKHANWDANVQGFPQSVLVPFRNVQVSFQIM